LRDLYTVIYSPLRQSAKEFFHYLYHDASGFVDKFKYFSIYYWLCLDKPKRLLGCAWKDEGVTLDARGEIFYCAVQSDSIGSLRNSSGEKIFFADQNIKYRESIVKTKCDDCIHDYNGKVETVSLFKFCNQVMQYKISLFIYLLLTRFMK